MPPSLASDLRARETGRSSWMHASSQRHSAGRFPDFANSSSLEPAIVLRPVGVDDLSLLLLGKTFHLPPLLSIEWVLCGSKDIAVVELGLLSPVLELLEIAVGELQHGSANALRLALVVLGSIPSQFLEHAGHMLGWIIAPHDPLHIGVRDVWM